MPLAIISGIAANHHTWRQFHHPYQVSLKHSNIVAVAWQSPFGLPPPAMKVMEFNLNLSLLQLSLSLEWPCCPKRREAPMPVQVPVPVPVRVPGPVSSDRPSGSTCARALPRTVCQGCREVDVYITVKGKGSRYHSVQCCSHAMVALTPCEARARGFSRCTLCFRPRVPT